MIETTEPVTRRSLKNKPGDAFRCVAEGLAVPLSKDRAVDAYIVPAGFFEWGQAAAEQLKALRWSLALLVQASAAGVQLPETTTREMGEDLLSAEDISRLNAFQAAFPIHFAVNEEGAPLTRVGAGVGIQTFAEDEDEDLVLVR